MILIVVSALGMVQKDLERRPEEFRISGRIEIVQTITLLRSAKILTRILESRGDMLFLRL